MPGTLCPGALGPWMGCCGNTTWCGVVCGPVLGRSRYGAGRMEGVKAVSESRRNGGEGVYCSHRKSPSVPLWPAISLTYN